MAGDLRIPHFIGMHALRVLPILVIVLEFLSQRMPCLAFPQVRLRLVRVAVVTYVATLSILTWQELAGQSIVSPAGPILAAGAAVAVATVIAAVTAIMAPERELVRDH
ncbi:hypothetical protein GCM10007382_26760 [Salinibacterium xinjiangense]|uniref:hypothetical protein n=1 Tax=Salinibacterium xinjiangense TaxID=386302 RepID=UPI0019CBB29B|nr:hypothetical protein [Salinibacterium xinjiangense]GGL05553.1 hypothetical protein GCM10007382_26760 [Salinibacterium xinjiangense]